MVHVLVIYLLHQQKIEKFFWLVAVSPELQMSVFQQNLQINSTNMPLTFNLSDASHNALDGAILGCVREAVEFLANKYGFSTEEAFAAMSLTNPTVRPSKSNGTTACDGKAKNGKVAAKFEKLLCDQINNKEGEYWDVIYNEFKNRDESSGGSKTLDSAELMGGCNKHYDLLLKFEDGTTEQCELKWAKKSKKKVEKMRTPWEQAGQYLNGTGPAWRIREWYARQWHEQILLWSKKEFDIEAEIPDFEEWFKKDMSSSGAKTDFAKELKVELSKPTQMEVMKKKKAEFVKKLVVPDEIKKQLYEDYRSATDDALAEKDCWLTFNGVGECRLWGRIQNDDVGWEKLERKEDSVDLVWYYDNASDGITREIRVRFQNGIGIANLSVQCK